MSQVVAKPPPPPLRNNDQALEHYADGPVGVNFLNGNLHITFATQRADHTVDPASQYRMVTLRLVIPIAGATDLQKQITGMLSLLQRQGVVQPIMPGTQTKQ
jgi:hypothetical protein